MKDKKLIKILEQSISPSATIETITTTKGNLTTVIINVDGCFVPKNLKFIGQSICDSTDEFNPRIGYDIARKRAENQLLGYVKTELIKQMIQLESTFVDCHNNIMDNKRTLMGDERFEQWFGMILANAHGCDGGCSCE